MIGAESPFNVPADSYLPKPYYLSNSLMINGVHEAYA
jgi:hypothetical protein